jgi:nucleotide-binding universal stress UspA family protein
MFSRTSKPAHTVTLTKDPAGRPAVDLAGLRDAHPSLVKKADKAGVALSKRDLTGIRAQAVLVLDHSGSMYSDFASGAVQELVERALGFALQIDADGVIPVIPFDSRVYDHVMVGVDDYATAVSRVWQPSRMGSTRLDRALLDVWGMAKDTDVPMFALVVTDGNPDDRRATTEVVIDLAMYPVFVKFLALRDVPYLAELDDLDPSRRLVDNVDTKVFPTLAGVTDLAFADAMADEWDTWLTAAQAAGIVR